jgi:hypothetical protein
VLRRPSESILIMPGGLRPFLLRLLWLSSRSVKASDFFFLYSFIILVKNCLIMPEVGHWMSNFWSTFLSSEITLSGLTVATHSIIVRSSISRWHTFSSTLSAPNLRNRLLVELSCCSRLTTRSYVPQYDKIKTIWKLEASVKLTTLFISLTIGSSLTLSKRSYFRPTFT